MALTPPRPKVNPWLRPLSWLYGLGVGLRNGMFDAGLLRETAFDVPLICVGNLTVGGTGKTPHSEYIVRLLLQGGHDVALLSRGYKRKTQGWQMADEQSTADDIGDEPFQIHRKYPQARVAVDADRRQGIAMLLRQTPPPECIVLDDAFQHRYVKAGLNILLTDFNRLYVDDALLPAGRLREPARGRRRAQVVIVTKCPPGLSLDDCRLIRRKLHLGADQNAFFTSMTYGTPYALFTDAETGETGRLTEITERLTGNPVAVTEKTEALTAWGTTPPDGLLAVSGIARPEPFFLHARTLCPTASTLAYPDHHAFRPADLVHIDRALAALDGPRRRILTTEKDAARLLHAPGLTPAVRAALFVQPIDIRFLHDEASMFNDIIFRYVRDYQRNR